MEPNSRLLRAVVDGILAEVIALVDAGADPNAMSQDGIWVALDFAIEHDHPELIRALIDRGAAVNIDRPHGWTLLHHAVSCECDFHEQAGRALDLRLIEPLVRAGADARATCSLDGWQRYPTPIDLAKYYQHQAAVRVMTGPR